MDSAVLLLIIIAILPFIFKVSVKKTNDFCTIFVCSPTGVDICHKIELNAPYTRQFYPLGMT